jgi:molecular chaperone GrpE
MPDTNAPGVAADAALDAALAEETAKAPPPSAAEQKIAELESQLREAGDKALRAGAELENYRKRAQRELADERRYAIVPLVRDLLAVVDNLERAIGAAEQASSQSAAAGAGADAPLLAGVKMVATQLEGVLKQHGCVRIETVGAPFDPNFHQALAQEPSETYPAGTITREAQVGFKLHDRVIRPAQVFVSTGPGNS